MRVCACVVFTCVRVCVWWWQKNAPPPKRKALHLSASASRCKPEKFTRIEFGDITKDVCPPSLSAVLVLFAQETVSIRQMRGAISLDSTSVAVSLTLGTYHLTRGPQWIWRSTRQLRDSVYEVLFSLHPLNSLVSDGRNVGLASVGIGWHFWFVFGLFSFELCALQLKSRYLCHLEMVECVWKGTQVAQLGCHLAMSAMVETLIFKNLKWIVRDKTTFLNTKPVFGLSQVC